MTPDDDRLPNVNSDETPDDRPQDSPTAIEPPRVEAPEIESNVEPDIEPDIEPQPAPSQCHACGASSWELYAHLPIETEAYLAAVAALNRRSRSVKKPKRTVAEQPPEAETLSEESQTPNESDSAESASEEATAKPEATAETPAEPSPERTKTVDLEAEDTEPPAVPLGAFPHGTAWRCQECGALSLVWPIEREPLAAAIAAPARRRSSPEFRTAVTREVERARSASNLKTLRALDLNLGRGTNADRSLALLHELGLAKHQIFGIGDAPQTADKLNLAGYQVYRGTLDRALAELPDDYFDLVLGFNTIEYWHDPIATLREIVKKLRVGGRLVLELSNPESWQARLFRHGHWSAYRPDCRILLGETAFRRLGDRVGLEVAAVKAHPEPQAWKASSDNWTRRKRHPLRFAIGSGLGQSTLIGLDRLRAACGMATSRYGAIWVKPEPARAPDSSTETPLAAEPQEPEIEPMEDSATSEGRSRTHDGVGQ